MNRVAIALLALALCAAPGRTTLAESLPEAEAVLLKMSEAFKQIRTLSMDLTTTANAPQKFSSHGQYLCEPAANKFSITAASTVAGQMHMNTRTVCDGKTVWVELERGQQKVVQKMSLATLEQIGGTSADPLNASRQLREQIDFVSVASSTTPAGDVYVLEGSYKPSYREQVEQRLKGMPPSPQSDLIKRQMESVRKIRVMILKNTFLPCGQETLDAQGSVISSSRSVNIKVNPDLPAGTFQYTPPAGVAVMDMDALLYRPPASAPTPAPK